MKVLMIVANSFRHDSRVHAEAAALSEAGHHVCVINWDRTGAFRKHEIIDGIEVFTVYPRPRRAALWSLHIASFMVQAFVLASRRRWDVVHCHDLDVLAVGAALKCISGCRLVYDAHEIYTQLLKRGRARLVRPVFVLVEKAAKRHVDKLIVADDTYIDYFTKAGYGSAAVVSNYKVLSQAGYEPPRTSRFTLCYIGVLSRTRGISQLIACVKELSGVDCVIAGDGAMAPLVKDAADSLENITYLGRIPSSEVIAKTAECSCVVCVIDPSDVNNRIASANKQFEAMVTGRPVITTAGTRSGAITMETGAGLVIGYSKHDLCGAVKRLRDDPGLAEKLGRNAMQAAEERYNWQSQAEKLRSLYRGIEAGLNE